MGSVAQGFLDSFIKQLTQASQITASAIDHCEPGLGLGDSIDPTP
jgi:hypothetical protein